MRKFLLAGTPVFILASTLAGRAADMPVKAPPAIPTYDWSGFYAGVNVGAAWTSYNPLMSTFPNNSAATVFANKTRRHDRGSVSAGRLINSLAYRNR